jgi:hypothetical protein
MISIMKNNMLNILPNNSMNFILPNKH